MCGRCAAQCPPPPPGDRVPRVLIAPLRNPASIALAAVSASRIGGGRFRLGVGAGWLEEEFELVGQDFGNRFGRLAEIVDIVRRLAGGGGHAHSGRYYQFPAVRTTHEATPFPIVFGGLSDAAVRRAAAPRRRLVRRAGPRRRAVAAVREIVARERGGLEGHEFHVRLAPDFTQPEVDRLASLGVDRIVVPWEALCSSDERRSLPAEGKAERLAQMAARLELAPPLAARRAVR